MRFDLFQLAELPVQLPVHKLQAGVFDSQFWKFQPETTFKAFEALKLRVLTFLVAFRVTLRLKG